MKLKITEWALQERPRERMIQNGTSALSDAELIAIVLRTGTREETAVDVARTLLSAHENDVMQLSKSSIDRISATKGVGKAKAVALCAAFELGRRSQISSREVISISSAQDVARLMQPLLSHLAHESCWILYLDAARHVIGKEMVSSGGLNATIVDVRLVLHHALEKRACELIMVHNHPSGNQKAGKQDKMLTQAVQNAAQLLDIRLIDHVVIGGNQYFSFAEEGLL